MEDKKDENLPSTSFWKTESFENSLPAIAQENRMNIEEVKRTMEFLDSIFGKKEVEKMKSPKGERKKIKKATPSLLNVVTNKVKIRKSKNKNEDHEFLEFINFLGSEHKKSAGKEESSVPGLTMEELCGEKKSQEATAWRQLKTIYCQKETNMFGSKAIIYWQIEKSSKYSDGPKKEDANIIQYIPHKELEEIDIKNQALQKFNADVEEKDKKYTQSQETKKNDVLPNQRLYKNQRENWILDLNPWLEEVEPWKTMEKEGKCFSIKLIPDDTNLDVSGLENKQKAETTDAEIFDRIGKKKILLQSYLTTQEENLFAEIKREAEKNYNELTKTVSFSGDIRETRICCKVYKKNHSCKRLSKKERKPQSKKEVIEENKTFQEPSLELYQKLKELSPQVITKYSEKEKPLHPFFGDKGVISKQFTKIDKIHFSKHYKLTMKAMKKNAEKEKPIIGKKDKKRLKSKDMPITILPIAKGFKGKPGPTLDKEMLADLSWKVAEEAQSSEEDDPHELKFLDSFQIQD